MAYPAASTDGGILNLAAHRLVVPTSVPAGRCGGAVRSLRVSGVDAQPEKITTSSRDPQQLHQRLGAWLADQVAGGEVIGVTAPEANGMSSQTVLFDARFDDGTGMAVHELVARVAPAAVDVPVFATYDLAAQYRVMQLVARHAPAVPVPATRWLETDAGVLGGEFFVMDRVHGRVPPDVMPYTFEGWLADAAPADRRHLQDTTVAVLAAIHGIDLTGVDTGFLELGGGEGSSLRRHVDHWRGYYDWMRGDGRLPLVDDTFAWLEANWPADPGPDVLSWGDARIGNVIYDGFTPAAVLDWEMAAVGPAGIDVGWMVFLHTFFQDLSEQFGLAGLPDMFVPGDVAATYGAAGGGDIHDLDFYVVYAALRHALVMARVHERRVHFGEAEAVSDPDDAIMHRARLASLIGR